MGILYKLLKRFHPESRLEHKDYLLVKKGVPDRSPSAQAADHRWGSGCRILIDRGEKRLDAKVPVGPCDGALAGNQTAVLDRSRGWLGQLAALVD